LEVVGRGFDVSQRLCESGFLVIGQLHFTELNDVAPRDALGLGRHFLCDVNHQRHCFVLSLGSIAHGWLSHFSLGSRACSTGIDSGESGNACRDR